MQCLSVYRQLIRGIGNLHTLLLNFYILCGRLQVEPELTLRSTNTTVMAKIKTVEHFRVKPRWMFVKITDEEGRVGWGEATLEGHDLAVEGALDEIITRIVGLEAKSAA